LLNLFLNSTKLLILTSLWSYFSRYCVEFSAIRNLLLSVFFSFICLLAQLSHCECRSFGLSIVSRWTAIVITWRKYSATHIAIIQSFTCHQHSTACSVPFSHYRGNTTYRQSLLKTSCGLQLLPWRYMLLHRRLVWWLGVMVNIVGRINEVNQRRARLVL